MNLAPRIAAGSIVFIDEVDRLSESPSELPVNALSKLYGKLSEVMQRDSNVSSDNEGLLVLDGLSSFEWMGVPTIHLKRFVRAMFALCAKASAHILTFANANSYLESLYVAYPAS